MWHLVYLDARQLIQLYKLHGPLLFSTLCVTAGHQVYYKLYTALTSIFQRQPQASTFCRARPQRKHPRLYYRFCPYRSYNHKIKHQATNHSNIIPANQIMISIKTFLVVLAVVVPTSASNNALRVSKGCCWSSFRRLRRLFANQQLLSIGRPVN